MSKLSLHPSGPGLACLLALALSSCAGAPAREPLPLARKVDLARFMGPFKAEYLISYLDDSYSMTIIARSKRDYVWIMARAPVIADAEYDRLVAMVKEWGYDTSRLRKFPQPER